MTQLQLDYLTPPRKMFPRFDLDEYFRPGGRYDCDRIF